MTPLELSILMNYCTRPQDPENIANPLHQEICAKYCDDDILRPLACVIGDGGPHFKITEKGKVYFGGIMAMVSSVPLPIYVIPNGAKLSSTASKERVSYLRDDTGPHSTSGGASTRDKDGNT